MEPLVIYELHVRGYTARESGGGTFDALVQKIPHIKSLGVTAVELLPITLFNPDHNFWGYSPLDFFQIASHFGDGFQRLVDELHRNDIKCILDLVYNHTDPDIDLPPTYYTDRNDSGCGNTLNTNHRRVVGIEGVETPSIPTTLR